MDRTKELFSLNLQRLRGRSGMTQSEASEAIGVSLTTYQKYEYGKVFPSSESITKIADVFQVHVSDLFKSDSESAQLRPDLITSIVGLLSSLDEDELRNLLATAESSPSLLSGADKARTVR